MTIRELQNILADYHPDEHIGLMSESNRHMTFLGVNRAATTEFGHLVLSVDFTRKDKPIESPKDILLRQEEEIKKAIKKLSRGEKGAVVSSRKTKKVRTAAQQLIDGYIPTGKRGRPRKMVTEEEIIAKQAKQKQESNQFSNQSEEKTAT